MYHLFQCWYFFFVKSLVVQLAPLGMFCSCIYMGPLYLLFDLRNITIKLKFSLMSKGVFLGFTTLYYTLWK